MSDPGLHAALAALVADYSASDIVEALAQACEEAQQERSQGKVLKSDLYLGRAGSALEIAAHNLALAGRECGDAIENALNALEAVDEQA